MGLTHKGILKAISIKRFEILSLLNAFINPLAAKLGMRPIHSKPKDVRSLKSIKINNLMWN